MYVCICMCVCVCVYVCMYVYYVHTYVCYIILCICIHVCTHVLDDRVLTVDDDIKSDTLIKLPDPSLINYRFVHNIRTTSADPCAAYVGHSLPVSWYPYRSSFIPYIQTLAEIRRKVFGVPQTRAKVGWAPQGSGFPHNCGMCHARDTVYKA